MNRNNNSGLTLATPPAIHVGPIVTPGTNETISILIPLSAQLTTISNQQKTEKACKDCNNDVKPKSITGGTTSRPRNDKTKGCPFPTCTRYGRAFSRAHDLKRHIARHEMRKEKLSSDGASQAVEKQQQQQQHQVVIRPCIEYRENHLTNESVLRAVGGCKIVHPRDSDAADGKVYFCPHCKKRYVQENKFKSHLATHEKTPTKNMCALCQVHFQNDQQMQEHMKQHTSGILQTQAHVDAVSQDDNKDDDFLLEEMLLLNKNPRRSDKATEASNGKTAAAKIRCDYCSKTFKTKWTLSSHVAAHEGRFQFDCGQCGKKFVRKSHYEGHVRSHEAARPYVCEQCGKTFKEVKHRREHTKRKHPRNQSAIQSLLDSISPCASEEVPVDQAKFTLLMPVNFTA